ncbi:D-erythrulose reductase-like [Mercenaria mercenaria]|uniref:D-erythrulose reductase-like n=1 Tax=Mercenaria mercenaria TaxID=6596 RepID=UPI001E1D3E7E|nr:D-erythrulose reductase-like [Mercenaria mercenaria]
MSFDFSGKKVLVTGAGKGIGRGVAIALSESGCKVYALSRTKSTLDSLTEEYPSITPIVADLCDWEDTKKKIEKLEVLDGLVNNAGISAHDYAAVDCPRENICKVLDNNLLSAINCSQVIAKKMIEAKVKGSIVNVSSIGGLASFPNGLPYNISKAAMDMASKVFALELGPHGIRVNSVNPSLVMTPMIRELIQNGLPLDKTAVARSSMGRLLEMNEIVDPILYLLSDHSAMVTGQMHVVDGGLLCNITTKI